MNKEEMERRIYELESELIELKRFYLAFRISKCDDCNVRVMDWESPIFFVALDARKNPICERHQKELDEFNRTHASD